MCMNFFNTTIDAGTYTTGTTDGAAQTNPGFRGAYITALYSAVSGSSPSIALSLQYSPDGGTTWVNFDVGTSQGGAITQSSLLVYPGVNGNTVTEITPFPLPQTWRVVYHVSGAGSSYTMSTYVNYLD